MWKQEILNFSSIMYFLTIIQLTAPGPAGTCVERNTEEECGVEV
jgi:hypothetical protein